MLAKKFSRNFEKTPPKNALPFQTSEGVNSEPRKGQPIAFVSEVNIEYLKRALKIGSMARKEVLKMAFVNKACRWYDNEYDCQHEQRGKAHQHGYISPYLRNAEL